MPDGNGHKDEQQKMKYCPLLNKDCIGGECAFYIEMSRVVSGFQQTFGMCSFTATVQILSEMNLKAQQPQQQIQLPKILGR